MFLMCDHQPMEIATSHRTNVGFDKFSNAIVAKKLDEKRTLHRTLARNSIAGTIVHCSILKIVCKNGSDGDDGNDTNTKQY